MTNDYIVSVGSDPLNPLVFTYSAISMTGNITLVWPLNNQNATYTATSWVDITSSAAYIATMPDATNAPIGQSTQFNNYGSFTITVNDSAGNSITTIPAGQTKRIWITDNSTAAGTWRVVNIGVGTSSADASALAGYGLQALSGQLSEAIRQLSYSSDQTLGNGQLAYLIIWTGGSGTFTLTNPATLNPNWFFYVKNAGSGTLTLSPAAGLIDGQSSISVGLEEGFTVATNAIDFYTIGRIVPTSAGLTLLNKSIAGGTDVTLTATEAAYNIINLTGAVSASIGVIVPVTVREWIFYNATTGTYTTTVRTSLGTGVSVTVGTRNILYCDGTDVFDAVDGGGGGSGVTNVATGTGLTGGPITTTGTIALNNTAVTAGTYGAAGTTVTFTVDAQGRLTNSTSQAIVITDSNLSGVIGVAHGGTNSTTLTLNNVMLGNGTGAVQFVAPGTSGNFLQSNGTTWAGVSTLGSANGGTGRNTLTANYVLLGNGTSSVQMIAPGSSGNVLTSDGTTWASTATTVPSRATTTQVANETNTTAYISPDRLSSSHAVAKAFGNFSSTSLVAGFNIASTSGSVAGLGTFRINFTNPMSTTTYTVMVNEYNVGVGGNVLTIARNLADVRITFPSGGPYSLLNVMIFE